ncbi:hypothetical protein ACHOLT_00365 [Desulfitobacterium sp. Sab5]|uniref:hypothetical protein n=1 Tax=Desulfitobacterium nosdiversum TaxID=3375356 RepID=UPI003CF35C15
MSKYPFIYAKELKKEFEVYGSFYTLNLGNGQSIECRNALEIVRRDKYGLNRPTNELPDAIAIMMNSGSSRPKKSSDIPVQVKLKDVLSKNEVLRHWVVTQPDTTQFMQMMVANYKGWDYIRILNLSDIRCPKSPVFKTMLRELPTIVHSIFSDERSIERNEMLNIKDNGSYILAWGTDNFLLELANQALPYIPTEKRVGIPYHDSNALYIHASPLLHERKVAWLEAIMEQLA